MFAWTNLLKKLHITEHKTLFIAFYYGEYINIDLIPWKTPNFQLRLSCGERNQYVKIRLI